MANDLASLRDAVLRFAEREARATIEAYVCAGANECERDEAAQILAAIKQLRRAEGETPDAPAGVSEQPPEAR